jgi:hypothetical protein
MQRDEFEDGHLHTPKKSDPTAMRILQEWVAKHDGAQADGTVIDREFVVVDPRESAK